MFFGQNARKIARIFGIDIYLDPLVLFVLAFFTWRLGSFFRAEFLAEGLPMEFAYIAGALSVVGLYISVLFHELAHSLVARHFYGKKVSKITIFILGGFASIEDLEDDEGHGEGVIAGVGPLSSLLFAGLVYGAFLAFGGLHLIASETLAYLVLINIALAIFNLLPVFPMDGGRIFRNVLKHILGDFLRATRVAAVVGSAGGFLMISGGIGLAVFVSFGYLWLTVVGFFIFSASRSQSRHIDPPSPNKEE